MAEMIVGGVIALVGVIFGAVIARGSAKEG